VEQVRVGHHVKLALAAQIEFETKVCKQIITFWFQALSSRRFQRGFDGVNLHRPGAFHVGMIGSTCNAQALSTLV
jgi:hypothetical protein